MLSHTPFFSFFEDLEQRLFMSVSIPASPAVAITAPPPTFDLNASLSSTLSDSNSGVATGTALASGIGNSATFIGDQNNYVGNSTTNLTPTTNNSLETVLALSGQTPLTGPASTITSTQGYTQASLNTSQNFTGVTTSTTVQFNASDIFSSVNLASDSTANPLITSIGL